MLAGITILTGISMASPTAAPAQSLPPGPRLPPQLLPLPLMLRPTQFLTGCRRRYGDHFTLRLGPRRTIVLTCDPDEIKRVFTGDPALLHAGEANVVLAPLLGSYSVLLLDEAEHMSQRKLLLPPFHGRRMEAYAGVMREVAERAVAGWPVGRPFAVLPHTQAITLEVIMRAVFGIEDSARLDALRGLLRQVLDVAATRRRAVALMLTMDRNGERGAWGRFRAATRAADEMLHEEIRARRADPSVSRRDDVLSLLLEARHEDGSPMRDEELRDELMTLLVAGHETTATALAWALERLVRHPPVLERAAAEVREQGPDSPYLDAVVKETLRLRPVVPAVARRVTEPYPLGGYLLPVGTIVSPSIFLTHRRADLYPDPEAFRPERFLERPAGTYTWIPFGGGVRRCMGASFALFEMKVVLATVLERVRLRAARGRGEAVTRRAITFAPARNGRIALAR